MVEVAIILISDLPKYPWIGIRDLGVSELLFYAHEHISLMVLVGNICPNRRVIDF